ncbi:MAG: PAS domain S-box protein [Pseudomonadota bacterium]
MSPQNRSNRYQNLKDPDLRDSEKTIVLMERDSALRNAVIDAALDCIIMMDQEGIIIEFNPAAEKTFGYTYDEAVGAKLADLIVPSNLRDVHHKGLVHYLATGEHKVLNKRVEVPAINKSGDDLIVELAVSPVEFGGETIFTAYLRDITDARAAEDKLRSSEERFQSLFDLSPDAIVVINGRGDIVDVNSRACELACISKDEMVSKKALAFVPDDQVSVAVQGVRNALGSDTVEVQIDFLNASGERIPTEVVGRRIETDNGPLYHGVVRDVSQRIAGQKLLRNAKETAERANAAKSDFLANMSHEMRTPLNGVIGSLSLIDRKLVDVETTRLIDAAERSAETLLTLIDDLLDLSRIEAGETELEYTVFQPEELSSLVSEVFRPLADKKSVALLTEVKFPSWSLRADVGKIRQVLINLVGNALKFTQRGQVEVTIDYTGDDEAGDLLFEVIDTGIGISSSDQEVLFDRFKQADSSRSKSHGGAGLGLSICKELVDIMDGTISVRSEPGIGSTFSFQVPVTFSHKEDDAIENELVEQNELSGHVLIAEDSETNAMVAKKMLDRLGLKYHHVTDGAAAVDAALACQFDVVLMDVSMPYLDGLEATRILRDRGFEKPIIAMTAHALKGDRDHALQSGMTGYLTKPVRPQALQSALEEWLPTRQAGSKPTNSVSDALDATAIRDVWDGDLETFAEIGRIFLDELEWRLPGLKEAKGEDLEHHAHSLKGAALNIGASELSYLASELESVSKTRDLERVQQLIGRIGVEAEAVRNALERDYLGENANV